MTDSDLNLPNIFVIGLQGKLGINLINGIIGDQILTKNTSNNYIWLIENKYYTTSVNFCDLKDISELSSYNGEAILIYIDPSKEAVLEEVNLILNSLSKQCEFEKQIIVVDNFVKLEDSSKFMGLTKLEALNWSIKHGFELVELSPNEDGEYEGENPTDGSLSGFVMIKEALHAHCWPNLKLKDKKLQSKNLCLDDNGVSTSKYPDVENSNSLEVADMDNFSMLLSSLGDMKIKASSLPSEERKSYAEKLAISFWKSIGGDDDEIGALNADSE